MEILTENLFMDNREDMAFLESEEGAKIIINLHVDGILQYLSTHRLSLGRWPEDIELGRNRRNMQSIFCIMKNILNFAIGTQFK